MRLSSVTRVHQLVNPSAVVGWPGTPYAELDAMALLRADHDLLCRLSRSCKQAPSLVHKKRLPAQVFSASAMHVQVDEIFPMAQASALNLVDFGARMAARTADLLARRGHEHA